MRVYIMMDIISLVSYHIRAPLISFLFLHDLLVFSFSFQDTPLYICTYSYSCFFFAVEVQVYTFFKSFLVPTGSSSLTPSQVSSFNSERVPNKYIK